MFEIFAISLLRRLMIIFKSIKAYVRYRAFETLQIELYHVVHYDSKCSTKFHKACMFAIFVISLLRRLMILKKNFFLSIRAHVRYTDFATLQMELHCVVHYDSKWSTKFHTDCMFEIFVISLLRRLIIIFKFLKSIKAMFDTELLQHSKLNCTM